MPSLIGGLAILAAVMLVFAGTMHAPAAAVVTIFVWGVAAFATVAGLQSRVVEKARAAPNLAASLNIGAFNLGNALGAALGGGLIDAGFSYPVVAVAGAAMSGAGCLCAILGRALDGRPGDTG